MLSLKGRERDEMFRKAVAVRDETISTALYLRGLIEFSNICTRDCLYCGIRKSNHDITRYEYGGDVILPIVSHFIECLHPQWSVGVIDFLSSFTF